MMLMGIPLVFFVIGMVYYLISLSEALWSRAGMQDAADSAALSAAIMHARGMNLIALTNQVMASLLAVLIVVRLFDILMVGAVLVAQAMAPQTHGASLSVVDPAQLAAIHAQALYGQLSMSVPELLRTLHRFELGIAHGMPVAAQSRVEGAVEDYFAPPASTALAIPGQYPMPVEEAPWPELCARAETYAKRLIGRPVDAAIGGHLVTPFVKRSLDRAVRDFTRSFCVGTESGALVVRHPAGITTVPFPSERFPGQAGAGGGCGGGQMTHHRVAQGVALGDEPLQLRALVFAETSADQAGEVVEQVPFRGGQSGEGPGGVWASSAASLAKTAVAQAEYYFDTDVQGATRVETFAWEARWRARLRRVRAPDPTAQARQTGRSGLLSGCSFDDLQSALVQACSTAGNPAGEGCPDLNFLNDIEPLVMH